MNCFLILTSTLKIKTGSKEMVFNDCWRQNGYERIFKKTPLVEKDFISILCDKNEK